MSEQASRPGDLRRLVVLIGPTAVGKTSLSIELASHLGAEIVSMDSRLLYRGMDIGTAKPAAAERERVPHWLIDVAEPDQTWSLTEYVDAARRIFEQLQRRGRLPLLVGGTGQYYRALVEGWQPPQATRSDAFRRRMAEFATEQGEQALHRELAQVDPESAGRIDARNVRRVVRALEIFHLSGRPASEQRRKQPPRFPLLVLGLSLPRGEIYDRIDRRLERMLEQGWLGEVQALLDRGYTPDLPSFSAIGYRELARHLAGSIDLEQAKAEIRRGSRQFVRRQANWFKRDDPRIEWYENRPGVQQRLLERVERWLSTNPD